MMKMRYQMNNNNKRLNIDCVSVDEVYQTNIWQFGSFPMSAFNASGIVGLLLIFSSWIL